jgi:exodeoxyribonuclease VII small subunit
MSKKKPSYEEKVEELEAILRRLDDAETPIDTLAEDVKKGASLIKELDHKLRDVEAQVRDAFAELEAVQTTES